MDAMEIHQQIDVATFTCNDNNIPLIIFDGEVVFADNIVHVDPSIHLVTCEGER